MRRCSCRRGWPSGRKREKNEKGGDAAAMRVTRLLPSLNAARGDKRFTKKMVSENTQILLAEYNANIELWKHDDDMRLRRSGSFLTSNVLLYGLTGFLLEKRSIFLYGNKIMLIMAVLIGISVCLIWIATSIRQRQYMQFRRKQLIEIEAKIGTLDAFTQQYAALSMRKNIVFKTSGEEFKISWIGSFHSSKLEGILPLGILLSWLAVLVLGII